MLWRPRHRVWTPAPSSQPVVPLAEMQAHLRVDGDSDWGVIASLEAAAVEAVERYTQRLLRARSCELLLPGLPGGRMPAELPGGMVSGAVVLEIEGHDAPGVTVAGHSPAAMVPDEPWPALAAGGWPVRVVYTAGFALLPADLVSAVKMIAAHLYERREAVSDSAAQKVPMGAEWLMRQHRIGPV